MHNVIASCRNYPVPYWMKAMTQTLPVATCLHTINLINQSTLCTQCDQGPGGSQNEVSHIFSVPVLNFILVCKVLAASLYKLPILKPVVPQTTLVPNLESICGDESF